MRKQKPSEKLNYGTINTYFVVECLKLTNEVVATYFGSNNAIQDIIKKKWFIRKKMKANYSCLEKMKKRNDRNITCLPFAYLVIMSNKQINIHGIVSLVTCKNICTHTHIFGDQTLYYYLYIIYAFQRNGVNIKVIKNLSA